MLVRRMPVFNKCSILIHANSERCSVWEVEVYLCMKAEGTLMCQLLKWGYRVIKYNKQKGTEVIGWKRLLAHKIGNKKEDAESKWQKFLLFLGTTETMFLVADFRLYYFVFCFFSFSENLFEEIKKWKEKAFNIQYIDTRCFCKL